MNLTSNNEDAGLIPGLAQWVKDLVLLWHVVEVSNIALVEVSNTAMVEAWELLKKKKKKSNFRVPIVVQWKRIQLVSLRIQVQSLAPLSGLRMWDLALLWVVVYFVDRAQIPVLWMCQRPAAVVPIRPQLGKPPYAAGVALKSKNNNK